VTAVELLQGWLAVHAVVTKILVVVVAAARAMR